MNNKKTIITIIIVLTIVFAILGATFAYWSWASDNANKTNVTFTIAADFSCGINGEGNITGANLAPASCTNSTYAIQRAITTTITNNGSDPVSMDMWLKVNSIDSGLANSSNFKWALTQDGTSCTNDAVSNGTFQGKSNGSTVTLFTGETNTATYYLYIWLDSAETSTATQNQSFSLSIGGACTNKHSSLPSFILNSNAPLDSVRSTYVDSDTGIDFALPSSNTNGKGLYIRSGTENNTNPIYYYRGDVDNNHVILGVYDWRIVRTTDTGGLKLVLDSAIELSGSYTVAFNSNYNDSKYIGYMYNDNGTMTNSTIKTAIDNWYTANLSLHASNLEDTPFCNDRSVADATSTNMLNAALQLNDNNLIAYKSVERVLGGTPTLACLSKTDAFTVDDITNGNGLLDYPIGLLTIDEMWLAGIGLDATHLVRFDADYYLHTDYYWWLLSPFAFSNGAAMLWLSSPSNGLGYSHVAWPIYIRPVVSLKLSQDFPYGDGTSNNPYRFTQGWGNN